MAIQSEVHPVLDLIVYDILKEEDKEAKKSDIKPKKD